MDSKTLLILGLLGVGVYFATRRPPGAAVAESAAPPVPRVDLRSRLADIGRLTGRGPDVLGDPNYAAALSGISPNIGRNTDPPESTDPDAVGSALGLMSDAVLRLPFRSSRPSRATVTTDSPSGSPAYQQPASYTFTGMA